jgi:hypothetical protein
MPTGPIDPVTLGGTTLRNWYVRSPGEIEQERQAAAAQRYQDFFHSPDWRDVDPGFRVGLGQTARDIDPGFTPISDRLKKEVDPCFSWGPTPANYRFGEARGNRAADLASLPTSAWQSGQFSERGLDPSGGGGRRSASERGPFLTRTAASRSTVPADNPGAKEANRDAPLYPGPATPPPSFISGLFGGPVPMVTPAGNVVGYYDHQAARFC